MMGRRCARKKASCMIGEGWSVRMTLPMDMKKLRMELGQLVSFKSARERARSHPNVAPEPSMYCPRVRMMPFWPAPYRKMLTVPVPQLVEIQRVR